MSSAHTQKQRPREQEGVNLQRAGSAMPCPWLELTVSKVASTSRINPHRTLCPSAHRVRGVATKFTRLLPGQRLSHPDESSPFRSTGYSSFPPTLGHADKGFPLLLLPPHHVYILRSYHRRFSLYRIFILKLYFNSIYFRKSTIVRVLLFVKKNKY